MQTDAANDANFSIDDAGVSARTFEVLGGVCWQAIHSALCSCGDR